MPSDEINAFHATQPSYAQWLVFAQQYLQQAVKNDPYLDVKTDANLLLQTVCKRSKSFIFAFSETDLTLEELHQLEKLLRLRATGLPMAYLLGEKEFWSLPLSVSSATLIPRPDTERLVEVALAYLDKHSPAKKWQILDLGTGTGAIALALASELGNRAEIVAVDKVQQAVELAEKNRVKLGLNNVQIKRSHWFEAIGEQRFHLIVSNPPYLDQTDEHLQWGDVRFEPHSALVAAQNGLADLRFIIENAPHYLMPQGVLILEHGWQQAVEIQHIFAAQGWQHIHTEQDYSGRDRLTWAIWNHQ